MKIAISNFDWKIWSDGKNHLQFLYSDENSDFQVLMIESLRYHMFRTVTKAVEQFEGSDEGKGFCKEAL